MPVAMFDKCLNPLGSRQLIMVFAIATLLFVYPIIQADYPYGDDVPRQLFLGEDLWRSQGRGLMQVFQTVVGFSSHSVDVFPLPLLLMLPVLVLALASLTRHYFRKPCLFDCSVVLPLLYSPFFLGNLSYQYDGPMMILALCCVIFAITFKHRHLGLRTVIPGLLLVAAASLYQITLQVFVALCCIECLRGICDGVDLKSILLGIAERILQLSVACILYYFTAFQFYASWRGTLAHDGEGWGALITARLRKVAEVIGLLITDGNRMIMALLGVAAVAGIALMLVAVLRSERRLTERMACVVLCAIAWLVMMIAVPGIILVIEDFALNCRSLMAVSCVMVAGFYFARKALGEIHPAASGLLLIPLVCMLSFSFAYGRVLVAQKTLETSVVQSIGYDLSSRAELRKIQDFYLIPPEDLRLWLPAVAGTLEQMPALAFILDKTQITMAERFAVAGFNNVASKTRQSFMDATVDTHPQVLVNNLFYDIVRIGNIGYIELKTPEGSGRYKFHW
ncbi:glucosyltransferase domain-containing protein [Pseudomonas sp. NPDC090203]|uniref:glucosyltransferase domain-containing protein n=1 Tax=Pseudomonas sp. NPDC090203 TaxID=3364477 RepID=UPI00380444AA